VSHMPAERFPHIALFGCTEGSRTRGRPRKKWLHNVKEDCVAINLTLVEATRVAEDRLSGGHPYDTWAASARGLPSSSQRH